MYMKWLATHALAVSTRVSAGWGLHILLVKGHYIPYSAHMSPENTHKLMGLYMEVVILHVGVILQYMVSAFLTLYARKQFFTPCVTKVLEYKGLSCFLWAV